MLLPAHQKVFKDHCSSQSSGGHLLGLLHPRFCSPREQQVKGGDMQVVAGAGSRWVLGVFYCPGECGASQVGSEQSAGTPGTSKSPPGAVGLCSEDAAGQGFS